MSEMSISNLFGVSGQHYLLAGNEWWACEYAERPHDDDTCYKDGCPKCLIKARVTLHQLGDFTGQDINTEVQAQFSGWIARQERIQD
jgi:hypothetical protein